MRNWGKDFGLINLTQIKHSAYEIHDGIRDGTLVKLTGEVAIDREFYAGLQPWDQAAARAFAVGMTVDKAAIGGQSAARLWGLQSLGVEKSVVCQLPEGLKPCSEDQWPPGVIYRHGYLNPRDIREFHGIRVTAFMRTFLDIAHFEGLHPAVVAIDSARHQHPAITQQSLFEQLKLYPRYRGAIVLREAIALSVNSAESAQETRARLILHEAKIHGVRSIRAQVRFERGVGNRFYAVDFLINEWIIVEIDGRSKYQTASPKKLEELLNAERDREKFFSNRGFIVLRISPKQMNSVDGQESEFLQLLKKALVDVKTLPKSA